MSGGSYSYLFVKSAEEILDCEETLQQMADRLAGLGYAPDAARETYEALLVIRQYRAHMSAIIRRMSEVWQAVEYRDSNDYSDEDIREAIDRYRKPKDNDNATTVDEGSHGAARSDDGSS